MSEQNKHNLLYFEFPTMKGLYDSIEDWQNTNHKRLLSLSIQQDGGKFCCIALSNPTEVMIVDASGKPVRVTYNGELVVWDNSHCPANRIK